MSVLRRGPLIRIRSAAVAQPRRKIFGAAPWIHSPEAIPDPVKVYLACSHARRRLGGFCRRLLLTTARAITFAAGQPATVKSQRCDDRSPASPTDETTATSE